MKIEFNKNDLFIIYTSLLGYNDVLKKQQDNKRSLAYNHAIEHEIKEVERLISHIGFCVSISEVEIEENKRQISIDDYMKGGKKT